MVVLPSVPAKPSAGETRGRSAPFTNAHAHVPILICEHECMPRIAPFRRYRLNFANAVRRHAVYVVGAEIVLFGELVQGKAVAGGQASKSEGSAAGGSLTVPVTYLLRAGY